MLSDEADVAFSYICFNAKTASIFKSAACLVELGLSDWEPSNYIEAIDSNFDRKPSREAVLSPAVTYRKYPSRIETF